MTPDERNLLQQFLSDLAQARGVAKDPEADGMIDQAVRANPDALYLLVQHAIIADQALHAAQAQIQQMEQQLPSQPPAPSFLGGGGQYGDQYGGQYAGQSGGQGGGGYPPPQPPQGQGPLSANSGLGSFLRTAGTMAAGVAGGEFLAQGLSNLFSPRDW
jgi:uncharacterized protein